MFCSKVILNYIHFLINNCKYKKSGQANKHGWIIDFNTKYCEKSTIDDTQSKVLQNYSAVELAVLNTSNYVFYSLTGTNKYINFVTFLKQRQ